MRRTKIPLNAFLAASFLTRLAFAGPPPERDLQPPPDVAKFLDDMSGIRPPDVAESPVLNAGGNAMSDAATQAQGLTLDGLLRMSPRELAALYAGSEAGPIPDGDSAGKATLSPGTGAGKTWERFLGAFWKGKVFDRKAGTLTNKILGRRLVSAKVYYGESRADGKRSIILDYSETTLPAARPIRDEIRMVAPSLYLGYAYMRVGGKWVNVLPFALDFSKHAPPK